MRATWLAIGVIIAFAAGRNSLGQERKATADDVLKQLQGTWKFVSQEVDGKARTNDELAKQTITFEGDKWTVCMTRPGVAESDRPKDFNTKATANVVFIFERFKEAKKP